jgi:asparagine synthetase B
MGYCAEDADHALFKECFDKTLSRGPDDSRIVDTGKGLLGFHRLAIMGLQPEGMQPFQLGHSYVVCNGEIYGFERIRAALQEKGYTFESGSDCEILLPLYKEYGVEMFRMLDAEFALILYDGDTESYIAARDPIGIRPLYYGYDAAGAIVFASEPKNLVGLCGKIMPFPPGHYYKDGKFVCYRDITAVRKVCRDDIETVCTSIREKLIAGIRKRLVSDAKVGFLLSGGLDSSLETVIALLGTYDITTIRASMGMYLVCRAIHRQTDIRVLLTGEISDELFGYKYTDFAPSAAEFQAEAVKRIRELHMYDVLRADRCISVNSLEARVPFGDLDFVEYVMSIDPELKLNKYGKGKYLLRHAFEEDYLPHDILYREKAAFSDAVGHSMVDYLKDYAEHRYTDSEFEEKRQAYAHARPFTKESLLYREIFETYYPGQSEMVADFWMPNRAWKGCDVNDPSARVLANYGDSGK